jgi:hypothetical protein
MRGSGLLREADQQSIRRISWRGQGDWKRRTYALPFASRHDTV